MTRSCTRSQIPHSMDDSVIGQVHVGNDGSQSCLVLYLNPVLLLSHMFNICKSGGLESWNILSDVHIQKLTALCSVLCALVQVIKADKYRSEAQFLRYLVRLQDASILLRSHFAVTPISLTHSPSFNLATSSSISSLTSSLRSSTFHIPLYTSYKSDPLPLSFPAAAI